MNLLAYNKNKFLLYLENLQSEKIGFYFSSILHSVILILAIGLPNFFDSKIINIPTIIPIEIINVSDSTSIPKKLKDIVTKKPSQKNIKEKKFNSSDNLEIKKIEEKKLTQIKDKPTKDNITLKEDIIIKEKKKVPLKLQKELMEIKNDQVEKLPTKKIKPKIKPKPNLKKIEIEKKSDVVIKTKPKAELEKEFSIASMLKDLRNDTSTRKLEIQENIPEEKPDINDNEEKDKNNENSSLSIS